jgi:hypothetical protein
VKIATSDFNAIRQLKNDKETREELAKLLTKHHHSNVIINTSTQFQQAKDRLIDHIEYAHSSKININKCFNRDLILILHF